jgi:hypothetical protein
MKFGEHEFEAEGSNGVVLAELAAFKKLLVAQGKAIPPESEPTRPPIDIEKIMRIDGRVVSLAVQRESVEDAVLLLLFGQRQLRNNNRVSGAEIMDGLRASRHRVMRVDHRLRRLVADGSINAAGRRRARRYALTNRGLQKAQDIARELTASISQQNEK